LIYFLEAMGLDGDGFKLAKTIKRFDFSHTSNLAFIHSMSVPNTDKSKMLLILGSGGSHSGTNWKRTGYCGLGTAVKNLGLSTSKPLKIDFVVSLV